MNETYNRTESFNLKLDIQSFSEDDVYEVIAYIKERLENTAKDIQSMYDSIKETNTAISNIDVKVSGYWNFDSASFINRLI